MIYVLIPLMFIAFSLSAVCGLVAVFEFNQYLGFSVLFSGIGYGCMKWLDRINASEKLQKEMDRMAKEALREDAA